MRGIATGVLAATAAFLVAPLLVVTAYSFNETEASAELKGFTLRWYVETIGRPGFRAALWTSLRIGAVVTLISIAVGVAGAVAARLSPNPWTRRSLAALCLVPILTPELLMALGAAQTFHLVGLELGFWTVVLAHTSFGAPLCFLLTDAALSAAPFDDWIRAARDLGASGASTVRSVILPPLVPYVASSAALVWALSIDEFVLSFFLSGGDVVPLTVRLYSLLRTRGISTEINVACVLLMVLVMGVWLAASAARRRIRA
jgi:spermidine/putrescine transport system permease protein